MFHWFCFSGPGFVVVRGDSPTLFLFRWFYFNGSVSVVICVLLWWLNPALTAPTSSGSGGRRFVVV
jgi:hypothetical protein